MHTKIHTLEGWLRHCEQLHPRNIEMGLDRVREVARRMVLRFDCPVITVAGTNGKGSTCAMLEAVAQQAGYRTGVYTSPHLVHFEERCRVHGEIVNASDLIAHFEAVESARVQNGNEISLTYFEFTTLAILRLMSHARLDLAILEVGLGGRLDATNVIDADCAIITSIDIDHTEFLGPDRESIGREKAGIMRTGRPVIVGDPMAPQSVIDHALEIGADLWRFGKDFNFSGDKQQWSWAGRGRRYAGLAYPSLRGALEALTRDASVERGLIEAAMAAVHACLAQWDELGLHIRGAYSAQFPETKLAEALSLVMFPGSVPHFVEAARVWRDLVKSGAVPASPALQLWARIDQSGFDGKV